MKSYCFTTHQAPWRTEAAKAEFAKHGLDVEFYDGIHGATVGLVPYLPPFDQQEGTLKPGRIGVLLSKLFLWTVICERPDEEVLIFEDDVILCNEFKAEFLTSKAALPADWQVAHVGHCCAEELPVEKINDRISEIKHPLCCHAVLWKKSALQFTLQEFRKLAWCSPSDVILQQWVYTKLRHYCFTPQLAFRPSTSSIKSEARSTASWKKIKGHFDYSLIYDEALDRVQGHAVFVEIGSYYGRSAAYMGEEIKRRLLPVKFYCVDPWAGTMKCPNDIFPEFQRNISRAGVWDYVTPIRQRSVDAALNFEDGTVDFVFVDGDHSFDAVVEDILTWRPKLKATGRMAGHDIDREDVLRAVEQEFPGKWRRWERCWIVDNPK